MSPRVPSGARRMIHQTTFCTTASAARTTARKGSAGAPTLSAAMPTAAETTSTCSTLKPREVWTVSGSTTEEETCRPRKLAGTRPVRKPSHEPCVPVYASAGAAAPLPAPGWTTRPSTRPTVTAIRAVIPNHSSVFHASRAALETSRRLAIEEITAVTMSGTTAALSRLT